MSHLKLRLVFWTLFISGSVLADPVPSTLEGLGFVPGDYVRVAGDHRTCSDGELKLLKDDSGRTLMIGDALTIILSGFKEEPTSDDPCAMEWREAISKVGSVKVETTERCVRPKPQSIQVRSGDLELTQVSPTELQYRAHGLSLASAQAPLIACDYRLRAKKKASVKR